MKRYLYLYIGFLGLIWGCGPPTIGNPSLSMGEVDASRYIAIGSDYTVGLSDYGVFEEGQQYAFPNLLAQQISKVSSIPFNQAYIPKGYDSYWFVTPIDSSMNWECSGNSAMRYLKEDQGNNGDFPSAVGIDYQNLGAPCVGVADIDKRQIECPYLNRFSDTAISYLQLVDFKKPSFYTVELGFDDVWKYTTFNKELLSLTEFEGKYRKLLNTLYLHSKKGVLITIPDLTQMPYLLASKNYFKDNACNPVPYYIITDKGEKKLAGSQDYIPLYYIIKYLKTYPNIGMTSNSPIPKYMVMDSAEVIALSQMTQTYNSIIRDLGKEYHLPVFDLNKMITDINASGLVEDGVHFNDEYVFGGFYTLDGYSFSPRGNAMLTNRLITTINEFYKAQIPYLNVLDFPGQKYLQ